MTVETEHKVLREGSTAKRAAILQAARDLILADGFDRTSVDAIAARAGVSKRTVYDYFGDKRTLLEAVVEGVAGSLVDAVTRAVEAELVDFDSLEDAMVAFATRVITLTMGSSDYATMTQLTSREAANLPELADGRWMDNAPEQAIAERLREFDRRGWIDAPDPLLATDHFLALAFSTAVTMSRHARATGTDDVRTSVVNGVRAFLRAYPPKSSISNSDSET